MTYACVTVLRIGVPVANVATRPDWLVSRRYCIFMCRSVALHDPSAAAP